MSDPPKEGAPTNRRRKNNNPRAAKFNAGLTEATAGTSRSRPRQNNSHHNNRGPSAKADDLTSTLIRSLSVRPFLECLICFNPIHPLEKTWSCSPLIPIVPADTEANPQYCWSTLHLKCIRSWSEKSYKEIQAAWIARGEHGRGGEWRCPGCQGKRTRLIRSYTSVFPSVPFVSSLILVQVLLWVNQQP
jgi:transcriptional repressor NF-X1